MSSVLNDFLRTEATHLREHSEERKAAKLDWQRAAQELVTQMVEWLQSADPEGLLRVRQVDHTFEDYDLGRYIVKGLSVTLGTTTMTVAPSRLDVVGVIQSPGDPRRGRTSGRMTFDNTTDRLSLYRIRDDGHDVWLWWSQSGIGRPFDRESFESAVVSLLR